MRTPQPNEYIMTTQQKLGMDKVFYKAYKGLVPLSRSINLLPDLWIVEVHYLPKVHKEAAELIFDVISGSDAQFSRVAITNPSGGVFRCSVCPEIEQNQRKIAFSSIASERGFGNTIHEAFLCHNCKNTFVFSFDLAKFAKFGIQEKV